MAVPDAVLLFANVLVSRERAKAERVVE